MHSYTNSTSISAIFPIYCIRLDWRARPLATSRSFSLSRLNNDVAPFNSASLFLVLHVTSWPLCWWDIIRMHCIIYTIHLFTHVHAGSVSCAVEGSIRLDPQDSGRNINSKKYFLLQVCLFEQWSYVCSDQFDSSDQSVALHQLGSTYGYSTGGGGKYNICC